MLESKKEFLELLAKMIGDQFDFVRQILSQQVGFAGH